MSVAARITAFAATLVAVFVIALWMGQAFGPEPTTSGPQPSTGQHTHPSGGQTP
ncbi:hypothetical protein [Mycolicibacterium duvalii]|uniref:Uncharacterized protein n=1 Tax=Mycolicibacterium duvalii TaxID=39688 RepID=A0A7I7JVX2_9MYCO|nr:hypothetical protein [Mycolicibacterium duvalii]MCV7369220.1 hypothetical protein [Mycolicibacterium duvalii]BBX15404.1 hypothetical protein MDUV_02640 [Mycolicibacterium duvalii]